MLFLLSELMSFGTQMAKRYRKWVGVFGFAVLAYLIGFTNATHNLDYQTYRTYYDVMPGWPKSQWQFEKGYSYLSVWASRAGISYREFRFVICLAAVVLLYLGVRRFTQNTALFAGIYGATVFLLDATQVRNFLMICIVVFALSFLQETTWQNYLIATVMLLIAGQFHSLGYMFLLVVVMRALPFAFIQKISLWLVGLAVGLIVVINVVGVRQILTLLGKVIGLVSSRANIIQKVSTQYGDGSVLIRYVAIAVSAIAAFLLVWFLYKIVLTGHDEALIAKYQLLYCAVLTSVMVLPTLSLADDYSRIPRSIFLFVIIAICLYYDSVDHLEISRMRSLVTFMIVIVCAMNGFSHLYSWGTAFRGSLMYLIQLK